MATLYFLSRLSFFGRLDAPLDKEDLATLYKQLTFESSKNRGRRCCC